MDPHPEATDTADGDDGSNGFEAWTALQTTTDQPRANLIADIVGHPQKAPSLKELDYMNPALGEDAVRRHLGVLQDVGVVAELVVAPGDRVRGYPYKLYQLTAPARELFDRNDLLPVDAWQRQYTRVEKPGDIAELEATPRPASEPSND